MKHGFVAWMPACVLALGATYVLGIDLQQTLPLRAPLESAIPVQVAGSTGSNVPISDAEVKFVAVTSYLHRLYTPATSQVPGFTLYVGYYDRQLQGRTIHSPKNCLPGAGWATLSSRTVPIATAAGTVIVNEYLIQREGEQALVYYWYQGRGRVEANEYVVKWNLLRDAALRHRSEEALVRVMVQLPTGATQATASSVGTQAVSELIPQLFRALPS